MAALTGYTLAGTAVATLVAVAVAPLLAGAKDISTAAWFPGLWTTAATVLGAWVDLTLSVLVWGVIGLTVATVTRSVTIAIAGGIGYLMVFERLLGLVVDAATTTYLPGSVLSAVAAGGTPSLTYGTAIALAAGYAAVALAIAVLVFTRRDITS